MKAFKRIASLALAAILGLSALPVRAESALTQPVLAARVKDIIEADGYQFKDLNDNGQLDPYEDWRLSPQERAENLLSLMTASQKAAQMVHLTLVTKKDSWFAKDNVGFALVYEYIFDTAEADAEDDGDEEAEGGEAQAVGSARNAARLTNEIQELSESAELGIPIIFSMDTEAGAAFVKDATFLPDEINLGAANDPELTEKYYQVLKEELAAMGVRMALSPDADLITDPRWGRNQECYSEDTQVVQELIAVAVRTLQGGSTLTQDSIMATVKHFPGAGAQTNGVDGTPLTIGKDSLALHLAGFQAAIDAGVAAVMPYGYSTVPYLGGDAVDNSADQSAAVMTDLLRGTMGYTGIIQTDWGMIWAIQEGRGTMMGEEVSDEEAILIGITESRVDGIGGESIRLIDQMEELTNAGKIDEDILTAAATRIVKAKFELGVFENPYCDVEYAVQFVGNEEHQAVNLEAARKAMTLLKNDGILPLKQNEKQTILVCGPRAGDMDSLVGGWSSAQEGLTIADAVAAYAGENATVIYESDNVERIAELAKDADIIIVSVGEPSYQHDPPWGYDTLEITGSQQEILEAAKASGKPMVTVVTGGRPYILTWCDENTNAILEAYYPGSQGGIAIAETLFGLNNPTGKTPLQFPRDMDSVRNQEGDVSFDLENPLYDYGWGLSYGE